jgi:hypothetical protein
MVATRVQVVDGDRWDVIEMVLGERADGGPLPRPRKRSLAAAR